MNDSLPATPTQPADGEARTLSPGTRVTIVIPCYNEQEVLKMLYDRLSTAAKTWNLDYDVILINDGSRDGTWALMNEIHAKDPKWKMICLARNFGHQVALWTGLRAAADGDGEIIVVLDADLQDPPEVLPRFFAQWAMGSDVVYGVRENRKEGPIKKTAYWAFYRMLSFLADVYMPLDSGDFCLMDHHVVDVITSVREFRPFIRGLRAWVGFEQIALPYERHARAAGEVKYTFRKLMGLALDGIFSFSTKPLRLAMWFGGFVSLVAFLGAIFTLLQKIFENWWPFTHLKPVPGFATIVIATLFIGGVQLFCIGILGEYIGRIYENVKGRPPSVVSKTLGVENPVKIRKTFRP
ncbi:glycosyltransferase family 2 protein [soil metagenome]